MTNLKRSILQIVTTNMGKINILFQKLSSNLAQDYQDNSFYFYIKKSLDEFIDLLRGYKEEIASLLEVTKELNGNTTYRRFENLMIKINTHCLEILQYAYHGDILSATLKLKGLLYSQKYTDYKLADMYVNYLQFSRSASKELFRCVDFEKSVTPDNCNHLPFNLRQHASKGRFNQLGVPCLYLSDSIDCAQQEIGEIAKDKERWYSVFEQKEILYWADFTIPTICEIEKMTDYEKFSFLITYPLRLLCLTKTKNDNAKFNEEYLFSQLFFHIIFFHVEENCPAFDGICHTSTKDKSHLNYIIPAKYKTKEPPISGLSEYVLAKVREKKGPLTVK